ncbi:TadE/TadG family type IV pilus assembly protein [Nocardioides marmotae]|uniref:TadE/TadG family type IV pilus assembly protein n=1 Tax=Nocardioides marmotae TaxID=2663857 RepID=UPI001659C8D2|nr:TadE/TadG family type IV pilus assembly protein [Nocardioides marmotae]MBC9732263.1 pilus assembly protein [Nocardioides marmotae]
MEFALVAPLLIMLVFGIITYGFMLSFRQAVSQAAAEGAREAAVTLVEADRVTNARHAVTTGLSGYGVTCADDKLRRSGKDVGTCTVSGPVQCTPGVDSSAMCVSVSVEYHYRDNALTPTFPGLGLILPDRLAYTSTVRVS